MISGLFTLVSTKKIGRVTNYINLVHLNRIGQEHERTFLFFPITFHPHFLRKIHLRIISCEFYTSIRQHILWQAFVEKKKREELERIIAEENLNKEENFRYTESDSAMGTCRKRETFLHKIKEFFQRFFDISG